MAYLFDTDAISELFKKRPAARYVRWLSGVAREDQFTSAVAIGELYRGAYRSTEPKRHLGNIDRVLSTLTVLPFDAMVARFYGAVSAKLASRGAGLADADLQIGATALAHGLELVTGNFRHFERVPDLKLHRALVSAREYR